MNTDFFDKVVQRQMDMLLEVAKEKNFYTLPHISVAINNLYKAYYPIVAKKQRKIV